MRNLYIYLIISLLPGTAFSQSTNPMVVSAGGGDFKNTGFEFSFTIGELSIHNYTTVTRIWTEGFQQPFNKVTPLPLEWLTFTGRLTDGKTQLEWTTAQEIRNDHFEVQRSSDGANFSVLTEVKASVSPNTVLDYHATDPSPYDGLTHYRIRQVDIDGGSSYSSTITVRMDARTNWQVYPNPAHDQLFTVIHLTAPKLLVLDLYDMTGKRLLSRQVNCEAGETRLEWNVRVLTAGIYLIRCSNADLAPVRIIKE